METLFYSHADEGYGHFVLPFIYFALVTNHNYSAEVWVDDKDRYAEGVDKLNHMFGERAKLNFLYHGRPDNNRFLFQPETTKKYTYISDVDIITLDPEVSQYHRRLMGLRCYSNSIRPRVAGEPRRMSGVHFVESYRWYSFTKAARLRAYEGLSDEQILARIIFDTFPNDEKYLDAQGWNRPIHGIHMSPAREPYSKPGWEITPRWIQTLEYIKEHPTWPTFWDIAEDKWKELYGQIK